MALAQGQDALGLCLFSSLVFMVPSLSGRLMSPGETKQELTCGFPWGAYTPPPSPACDAGFRHGHGVRPGHSEPRLSSVTLCCTLGEKRAFSRGCGENGTWASECPSLLASLLTAAGAAEPQRERALREPCSSTSRAGHWRRTPGFLPVVAARKSLPCFRHFEPFLPLMNERQGGPRVGGLDAVHERSGRRS